ncbi:hypothetical protein LINPERPRIM_LOCUS30879 [Linum perenne]
MDMNELVAGGGSAGRGRGRGGGRGRGRTGGSLPDKEPGKWNCEVVDANGNLRVMGLKVKEAEATLGPNLRVVVRLLDGVLPEGGHTYEFLIRYIGTIAGDFTALPLRFSEWRDHGLKPYKALVWRNMFEPKFAIMDHDFLPVKRYIMRQMGRAWSRRRNLAYNEAVERATGADERVDRDLLSSFCPRGASTLDWCEFLSIRGEARRREIVAKNKSNKAKQVRKNRGGARTYNTMQAQLTAELGYTPSRGFIWLHAHRLADGTFSSDVAELARWIQHYEDQPEVPKQHGPGDSLDLAHMALDAAYAGEHSGRVRGKSFGYYPRAFEAASGSSGSSAQSMAPTQHTDETTTIARLREEMDRAYAERMQAEIDRKVKEAEANIEKKMEGKLKRFLAKLKGKKKGSSSTEKMRKVSGDDTGSGDYDNPDDYTVTPLDTHGGSSTVVGKGKNVASNDDDEELGSADDDDEEEEDDDVVGEEVGHGNYDDDDDDDDVDEIPYYDNSTSDDES